MSNLSFERGNLYIVYVPRLITSMWMKQFEKVTDLIVTLLFDEVFLAKD